jgi:hypothetical protein
MTNSQSPSRLYFLGAISIMFELRLIVGTYFWTNSEKPEAPKHDSRKLLVPAPTRAMLMT